jgi:hypothetical protein
MGVVRQSLHPNAKSPAMRRAYLFCLQNFSCKLFVLDTLQQRASTKPLETNNFPAKYRGEGGGVPRETALRIQPPGHHLLTQR